MTMKKSKWKWTIEIEWNKSLFFSYFSISIFFHLALHFFIHSIRLWKIKCNKIRYQNDPSDRTNSIELISKPVEHSNSVAVAIKYVFTFWNYVKCNCRCFVHAIRVKFEIRVSSSIKKNWKNLLFFFHLYFEYRNRSKNVRKTYEKKTKKMAFVTNALFGCMQRGVCIYWNAIILAIEWHWLLLFVSQWM